MSYDERKGCTSELQLGINKTSIKKSHKMIYSGKPINKVKVACAREMLGFVWECFNKVTHSTH